jgi:hypothetical protein
MNLPGMPRAVQTVARPSFLSAFLQNLGPAITGSLQAPKGSGVAGGLAGGFAGITKEQHDKLQEQFEQQQLDTTKQRQTPAWPARKDASGANGFRSLCPMA